MSVSVAAPGVSVGRLKQGLELLPELGFSAELIQQLGAAAEGPAGALETALAVVEAFPATVRRQADLRIPFDVTARTLRDLERRIREYRGRHGVWGFDRQKWMQQHLREGLFEIGRLQYVPGCWRENFDVYRGRGVDDIWAVAVAGLWCDAEGRPGSEGGGFRTVREESEAAVRGHLADPRTGLVSREPVSLAQGQLAAGREDAVLHVHIPSGPDLTPGACLASLREARQFFDRHFPGSAFRALCCRTWLLDPAWRKILPNDSNISQFSRLFRPLAVAGADGTQHQERIFGSGRDWRSFVPRTRLQKAAKEFLLQGGKFYQSAGFLLWEDPWLEREIAGCRKNTPMY